MEAAAGRDRRAGRASRRAGSAARGGASPARPTATPVVYGCCGSASTSSVVPISTMRPRYITAMRSAMFHATPRSWVTTTMLIPVSSTSDAHQGEDLAADRGVEAGHRLVGEEQARSTGPSPRRSAPAGAGRRTPRAGSARRSARAGAARPARGRRRRARLVTVDAVDAQPLGDRLVDRVPRVERAGRVLEDHLHRAPQRPQLAAAATTARRRR